MVRQGSDDDLALLLIPIEIDADQELRIASLLDVLVQEARDLFAGWCGHLDLVILLMGFDRSFS